MFRVRKVLLCCLCLLYGILSELLTECNDTIFPDNNDIIICTNQCNSCDIYPKTNNTIYSGSNNTNIYCNNTNSCSNSMYYIGSDINIPINYGYQTNDFLGKKSELNIICNGIMSCKSLTINVNGSFTNNVTISAKGINGNSFESSTLNCNLNDLEQICSLNCGNTNCNDSTFNCENNNCLCQNECSQLNGNYNS